MANKKTQHDSLNAEQASSTSEAFIDKYKKTIAYTLVAAVVLVAGIILYHNFVAVPKEARANELIFKGQDYFAENNYEKALNVDGQGYPGFIQIAGQGVSLVGHTPCRSTIGFPGRAVDANL